MKHVLTSLVFTTALLALPSLAAAQSTQTGSGTTSQTQTEMKDSGWFKAHDTDSSGSLSQGEFSQGVFAECDADRNNQVSQDEWKNCLDQWSKGGHK